MDHETITTGKKENPRRRTTVLWFCLVLAVAFGLRLAYLEQLRASPFFEHPVMDARVHHDWAATFARGEEWSVDPRNGEPLPYFRAPLYVWFLGTIYAVFGTDPGFTPRLIQSMLGALSCALVFLLGQRLFSRPTGILAGLGAALCWTLVYFDNELLIVPLIVFLDLVFLYLLVLASSERAHWALWPAAGFMLGLSAIARPNILLLAPPICLWILVAGRGAGGWWLGRWRRRWLRGLAAGVAFGMALLLPILPVTLRNVVVGNDTVLIASQGGVNFYIGNNPRTDCVTAVVPDTPRDWWGGYFASQAMAARELGHAPKPSEVSRYFFGKSFEFWRNEPGKALYVLYMKTRYFFCRQEFANNKCLYTYTEEFTPIARWLVVSYWIVVPLGLLGLGLTLANRRRRLRLFPLWGFVLVYTFSVVLFFIAARFRMPVVPPLIIFGAFALCWIAKAVRRRRWSRLASATLVLTPLFWLALQVPGFSFGEVYINRGESYFNLGGELARRGEWDEALTYLRRAESTAREVLNANPTEKERIISTGVLLRALMGQGQTLHEQGQHRESLEALSAALNLVPPMTLMRADILERMATLAETLERRQEAMRCRIEARNIRQRINRNAGGRGGAGGGRQ